VKFRLTGVIELRELKELGLLPPEERLKKGPVAILECPEQIPCNICVSYCGLKAIKMDKITDIPRVLHVALSPFTSTPDCRSW